ncbi:MAG: general secretion pathway protein GspK [Desulfobacteraceae bacterium]|nr:general secretion pathway protein GspK [Desulfobacteraceae bacterium]
MRIKPHHIFKNNRGIALIITLSIIAVLIVVTMELNRKVRSTVVTIATARDKLTLSHIASSGINIGMAILTKDKKSDPAEGLDSVQEDWARPEKISEVLQDIPFEKGSVSLEISDELGRIQLNALLEKFPGNKENRTQRALLDNLLRPVISEDEESELNATTRIVDFIKDWLDKDDENSSQIGEEGESDYYESLDPPYSCKNGPFIHINELLLVKDIKPEYFHSAGESKGLSDYLTVYGMAASNTKTGASFSYEGKININTAELPVIEAIFGEEEEECAQSVYDYREEKDEDSEFLNSLDKGWYKTVIGCGEIKNKYDQLIRTSSDYFRIESTATLFDLQLTVTAVIIREKDKKTNKWKCRVLSWETGDKKQAKKDEQKNSGD